jgi:hypothetical protein
VSPNFSTSSKLRLNRTPRSSLNGKPSTAQVTAFSTNSPMSMERHSYAARLDRSESPGLRHRRSVETSRRHRSNIRESPESRARHNRCLVNRRRPTMRARPETQQAKVYAHRHYGSDLSAASKALVHGGAVGLPTLVIEALQNAAGSARRPLQRATWRTRTESPDAATRPVMLANTLERPCDHSSR